MKKIFCRIELLLVFVLLINFSCKKEETNIPPKIEDQTFVIEENSPDGTEVGTVIATDESSLRMIYTIIDGNSDYAFIIESLNGEIIVNKSSILDYETIQKFELTVMVIDEGSANNSSTAKITITLLDISIPTDDMIGYYPFNGNANDESANENSGSVYGASLTNDRFGNVRSAYSFDGIGAYIDLDTALLPVDGSDFSISLWIDSDNEVDSIVHGIFSQYQSNPIGRFQIYEYNGLLKLFSGADFYPSGIAYELSNAAGIQWTNIILVNEANLVDIYVNAELMKSDLSLTNILNTNSLIGWGGFENRFYKGKIDDLVVYNRVLTKDEIQLLYTE